MADPRLDQEVLFYLPPGMRLPFVMPEEGFTVRVLCGHGHIFEARTLGLRQSPDYCPHCQAPTEGTP